MVAVPDGEEGDGAVIKGAAQHRELVVHRGDDICPGGEDQQVIGEAEEHEKGEHGDQHPEGTGGIEARPVEQPQLLHSSSGHHDRFFIGYYPPFNTPGPLE